MRFKKFGGIFVKTWGRGSNFVWKIGTRTPWNYVLDRNWFLPTNNLRCDFVVQSLALASFDPQFDEFESRGLHFLFNFFFRGHFTRIICTKYIFWSTKKFHKSANLTRFIADVIEMYLFFKICDRSQKVTTVHEKKISLSPASTTQGRYHLLTYYGIRRCMPHSPWPDFPWSVSRQLE